MFNPELHVIVELRYKELASTISDKLTLALVHESLELIAKTVRIIEQYKYKELNDKYTMLIDRLTALSIRYRDRELITSDGLELVSIDEVIKDLNSIR